MEINILGKGDGWEYAPKPGKGICWGINDLILQRDLDLVAEMHDFTWSGEEAFEHQKSQLEGYFQEKELRAKAARKKYLWMLMIEKINKQSIPFLTTKKHPDIPTSIEFPIDEVMGEFKTDYFGCGLCHMIAYAIMQGATVINFWGCNLSTGSEYAWQRGSFEFWLGVACGRGIEVHGCGNNFMPLQTVNNQVYGYSDKVQGIHLNKLKKYSDRIEPFQLGINNKQKQALMRLAAVGEEPRQYAKRGTTDVTPV